ncbi:hypothetical protein BDR26DRAFT_886937 [Obelidium mucronatum]|nr:hypothetical protein BDR26DRAFT_886937 [Obelidium mucronatum]
MDIKQGNQVLYIKYSNNSPVKIETSFQFGKERGRQLSDVSDVIEAVKEALVPRFVSTPIDELAIHSTIDDVESRLAGNLLLSDIPAASCSYENPLIIRSKNDTMPRRLNTTDSAAELCSIHPDVQTEIWKSVIHLSCPEFSGTGIIVDKTASHLYILTNLHLLGNDIEVMSHVSDRFRLEVEKRFEGTRSKSKHTEKRKAAPDSFSTDSITIQVEKYSGVPLSKLQCVMEFVLESKICWAASYWHDCMIMEVPAPIASGLEKCELGRSDYHTTLPVHIFGFPGILTSYEQFGHNYAVIPAEITGKDEHGHIILSCLSTPGLSGSAIFCTGGGYPIGYLGGGFNTSKNEQYQCYGHGLDSVSKDLPRFFSK